MENKQSRLKKADIGDVIFGFELVKKEFVKSKKATFYTLHHKKTKAQLLYFDRNDENKTFAVSFATLPEDSTGVFHILEHSVLNGSEKYPVKEPFVSLLKSSMQTFLNAMTFGDKTVYPVSSRNEKDFFNLMSVYLDAVFHPAIYERPEVFMQEGWHYEFDSEDGDVYYNGVVFSEMKGALSSVDNVIDDGINSMLFPDNCYGFESGGDPECIPDLTYEKFIETHRRFYHPSNSKIFLDGAMDIDGVLNFIDGEYLSKYGYSKPDFNFVPQEAKTAEKTVFYEATEDEKTLCHMACAKILCSFDDVEEYYAASILSGYLADSNEAPLKRAFLEEGLGEDFVFGISECVFQPYLYLVARNTEKENFEKIKSFIPNAAEKILEKGLDREALGAELEREAFANKEVTSTYGVDLACRALDSWLYGGDPLAHIDNDRVFASLREKLDTDYFEKLLEKMLCDGDDKSYLYVMPSLTKGEEDAAKEAERAAAEASLWTEKERSEKYGAFLKMREWQQTPDGKEELDTLPHLSLSDVERRVEPCKTELLKIGEREVLKTVVDTNGISYLNLYFDISDFTEDELVGAQILSDIFAKLGTKEFPAEKLQTKIKAVFGFLGADVKILSKHEGGENCKVYLHVACGMLSENVSAATKLLSLIMTDTDYGETEKIGEMLCQNAYLMKQSLIGNGHSYAIAKALSPFSKAGALNELLSGESYINSFSDFADSFEEYGEKNAKKLYETAKKAFAANRLFIGVGGEVGKSDIEKLVEALPESEIGKDAEMPKFDVSPCSIEIPASVGYSALGANIYSLGTPYHGSGVVLSSLVTYDYLWNEVRVKGGAYGTGMSIRADGDIFCYSYRDPNVENTKEVFKKIAEFIRGLDGDGISLDDIIISTVNSTDPHLTPFGKCGLECTRYLKGTSFDYVMKIREEILDTEIGNIKGYADMLEALAEKGKFCVVGDKATVAKING